MDCELDDAEGAGAQHLVLVDVELPDGLEITFLLNLKHAFINKIIPTPLTPLASYPARPSPPSLFLTLSVNPHFLHFLTLSIYI